MNSGDACRTSAFISKKTLEPTAPFSLLFSGPRAFSYCGSVLPLPGRGRGLRFWENRPVTTRISRALGWGGGGARVGSGRAWSPSLGSGLGPRQSGPRPGLARRPPPALSKLHSNSGEAGPHRTGRAARSASPALPGRTGRRGGRWARRRWGPDGPADARSARAAACPSGGSPRVGGGPRDGADGRPDPDLPPVLPSPPRVPSPKPRKTPPPFPPERFVTMFTTSSPPPRPPPHGHCPDGTRLF